MDSYILVCDARQRQGFEPCRHLGRLSRHVGSEPTPPTDTRSVRACRNDRGRNRTTERGLTGQPTAVQTALVPWKRDDLPKSRSAAPGWQGAKSELIGHK